MPDGRVIFEVDDSRDVWLSWDEWKARALNEIFRLYGVLKEPAKIKAATIAHGERRLGKA